MNIARILEATVERHPTRTALIYEKHCWTYQQWYARIRRFAQALADLGVRTGDRVAFYVTTSENSVTTYFACQILGAVAVPLNFRLSAGEASYVIQDSCARVFIYGRKLTDNALNIAAELPSVHALVCCAYDPDVVPNGHYHYETLAEATEDRHEPRPSPKGDNISALVYTSGTTGRPKGVIHTHSNDMSIAMNCVMEYGLNRNDNALHIAPLYHVGGMQAYFIPHLLVGGTNVVLGQYEAEKTLATIESESISTLFAVPTQIQEMLFHPRFNTYDVSSLRLITTGGAAISAATMERVINEFCPNIFNGYGMTEASLALLLHPEDALAKLGSCGKPTLITQARVIQSDAGGDALPSNIVTCGEIGQLIVRGPQAMQSYWNNPIESQKKVKHGWIYTGDLFSRDDDGFYYFHGRLDDMIVSGGENIYPREVEEVLYRCPGVQEAAVIGLPDDKWGSAVTAFVVRSDTQLSVDDIDNYFKANTDIAVYKRPKRYRLLDKLPTNPSGKVVKRQLLSLFNEDTHI